MILGRIDYEPGNDRILMNIMPMVHKVLSIANPMIGKSALPHFGVSPDQSAERMRVSALD